MTFAEKLRTLRKQAGFSQEKLAENLIELNGMKSELIISTFEEGHGG